jgi:NADH dehydrogenase
MTTRHRVVIVGGGFGGLYTARSLARADVEVTLLDRRNFHLFQPLLYQVATGGLSPSNISSPIREVLRGRDRVRVLLADVVDLDPRRRRVVLADETGIPYDTLIVATGVSHHYFGHDEWRVHAPGLKTMEDGLAIRRRVLFAFEAAEREPDGDRRREWLNFVVVGAGPTGVELAGALGELANDTLKHEFRSIDPSEANIVLVEGGDRVLPSYPPDLSAAAARSLRRLGVTTRLNSLVTDVGPNAITLTKGGEAYVVPTRCVLWAAGVRASPLAGGLAERTDVALDEVGRVCVTEELSIPNHPEIMIIGDLANFSHQTGHPLPGVAPVAMQQGRYAARRIRNRLKGHTTSPFRYSDKGSLATIGRSAAVADFGRLRFSGWLAWILWLFVHLLFLIQFRNRVLVMIQWAWSYITRNRSTRLIVGTDNTE